MSDEGQFVMKVLAPRNNQRDILAGETLVMRLAHACTAPIALELAGTPHERLFLVRGAQPDAQALAAQVGQTYPQSDVAWLSAAQDPARQNQVAQQCIELRLREPVYLPLRTASSREGRTSHDDLMRAADPMLGVLSAMAGLQTGESCLAQFALTPMPDDWAKQWRGSVADLGQRTQLRPQQVARSVVSGLGVMLLSFGFIALAFAYTFGLSMMFWGIGVMLAALGGLLLFWWLRLPTPPDPALIRQKVMQPACRVQVRLFAWAQDDDTAARLLQRLQRAFAGYSLAGANGFQSSPATNTDPTDIDMRARWFDRRPVLCAAEMAALWHLPHAEEGLQGIAYTNSRRLVPMQQEVARGVWVGHSTGQGREVKVYLPQAALRGNIGLIAKTQSGKSNLMAILASDVIANDPDATVIVIDPHRSLAEKVAALVPPQREAQTIFWSLSDRERPFGLNLIDRMPQGSASVRSIASASMLFTDKRVSDIIDAFNEIWPLNWGPRMEDYLRGPLLTLATVNEALVCDHAFGEWHREAHVVLVSIREAVTQGSLDVQALAMFDSIRRHFGALLPPLRASQLQLYHQVHKIYARFDQTTTRTDRLIAMRELQVLLCDVHAPKRIAERGAGLAARHYKDAFGRDRPLQYTLLDVNPLLASPQMRLTALAGLLEHRDQHLRDWWRDSFDAYLKLNPRLLMDMITPVRTKLNRFRASDIARRIFGQPESTIDLPKIINEGGVLLVDLASGVIGQETAALIGSALINWIASVIFARQESAVGSQSLVAGGSIEQPPAANSQRPRRIFLVIDEFQSIPGADYAFLLSELGKYGVQLCLGTQSLGLLDEVNRKTRRAWLDNTSALFTFRSGAEDARLLAHELSVAEEDGLTIQPSDIVGLPDYACFARLRGVSAPFRIDTRKADEGSAETLARIREHSRKTYGRDARMVDVWLAQASELQEGSEQTQNDGPAIFARPQSVPGFMSAVSVVADHERTEYGDYAATLNGEGDGHA